MLISNMKESEVFIRSGNVFADLGSPNPEERQLKTHLSIELEEAIASKNLNRRQASQMIGLTQEDFEKVIEGDLSDFSVGQLVDYLNYTGSRSDTLRSCPGTKISYHKPHQKKRSGSRECVIITALEKYVSIYLGRTRYCHTRPCRAGVSK